MRVATCVAYKFPLRKARKKRLANIQHQHMSSSMKDWHSQQLMRCAIKMNALLFEFHSSRKSRLRCNHSTRRRTIWMHSDACVVNLNDTTMNPLIVCVPKDDIPECVFVRLNFESESNCDNHRNGLQLKILWKIFHMHFQWDCAFWLSWFFVPSQWCGHYAIGHCCPKVLWE